MYVFTESWKTGQDNHDYILMKLSKKDVLTDFLTVGLLYVPMQQPQFLPRLWTKITKVTWMYREKIYHSNFFILFKTCFSASVHAFFCSYYCKLPSFDASKMVKYSKIYCAAVLSWNTPPIHIMCSLNLETFFKTIITTLLWTCQIKILLLTKFYSYWSLMFPTTLIFV